MSTKTFIPSRFIRNTIGSGLSELPDTDIILGIERTSTGGGSGNWRYLDRYGNPVSLSSTYFINHPIFRLWLNSKYTSEHSIVQNIRLGSKTYQDNYIYIPPFFLKTENSTKYWIAPYYGIDGKQATTETIEYYLKNGFRLYPAFYHGDLPLHAGLDTEEENQITSNTILGFYVSKYLNSVYTDVDTDTSYILSTGDLTDNVYDISTYEKYIESEINDYYKHLDTNGDSYVYKHIMSIYEYSAIQLLFLFYNHTTYVDTTDNDTNKQFYDIYGLYNTRWQYVKGLYLDSDKNMQIYTSGMSALPSNTEDNQFAVFPKDFEDYKDLKYTLPEEVITNGKAYYKNVDNTDIMNPSYEASENFFSDGVDNYIHLNNIFLPLSSTDLGVSDNYYDGSYSDAIIFDNSGANEKYLAYVGGSYYESANTDNAKDNGIFAIKFSNNTSMSKDDITLLGVRTCKIMYDETV